MRLCIFFSFLACLVAVALTSEGEEKRCPLACTRIYQPCCGMQKEDGVWVKKWFSNACEMKDENECEGGHYIPCPKKTRKTY